MYGVKRFFLYTMIVMFLLPSMGLHIDLSCCKSDTLENNSSFELPPDDCCSTIQEHNNCLSKPEICVPPTVQNFTVESEFSLAPLFSFALPFKHLEIKQVFTQLNNNIETESVVPIRTHSPSFLQVFLC